MEKVDPYGMKSGIIKIIPPREWKQSLPDYHDMVKQIRVREPIKQEIMGSNGTYRQVNILHQRIYNLPQWRQLCDQSEHQPPARRGERRANADRPRHATRARAIAPPTSSVSQSTPPPGRKRRGRPPRRLLQVTQDEPEDTQDHHPMTPVSPAPEKEELLAQSVEQDPGLPDEGGEQCDDAPDTPPIVRRMGFSRQAKPKTQTTSARRKYVRREGSAKIDEAAFQNWDYRMDVSNYTPERCEELERIYWKTLTYASPLYGADLLGTLFGESTKIWNLNKLPSLLDVLGSKVPGVNTAYLYLGMWKATFAWHLEDVDLYSINYLHFGAPKQWYSISQGDARRFEAAMKSIWPTEAKACDQFLRHKAFLISPAHLKQHYNITVNKCVSYPGEFVVTYPYGYHSGYNLGYNCAEAVNFALESWLPMGKIAKKCQCAQAQDSVWVNVYEIERRLRGEETEYEESEEESEVDGEDDGDGVEDEEENNNNNNEGMPLSSSQVKIKIKAPRRKRKRVADAKDGGPKIKKARLRLREQAPSPPCCLCPNDVPWAEILPTDDGREAHRMCALYLPETWIEMVGDKEVVANVGRIDKARLDLKCLFCRSKKGACFQCSQNRCPRSYHATCAAAAGVFVEEAEVPVFGEDGTEYKELAFDFSCRFHRTKRDKKLEGSALEETERVMQAAAAIEKDDICQMQFYRGDIFAGLVLENRRDEQALLVQIIPNGDRVEVEWKWLLLPDASDFRLPKASASALPMPTSRKAKQEINAKRLVDELPNKDDEFGEGLVWAEFHSTDTVENGDQVKIELARENQVWHYLPKTSTETKAQYTEDPARPQHNPKSNFLTSIPKPPKPVVAPKPRVSLSSSSVQARGVAPTARATPKPAKPYVYKPRKPVQPSVAVRFTTNEVMPKPQNLPSLGRPYPQHAQSPGHALLAPSPPSARSLGQGFQGQYQQSQNHLLPQQEQQPATPQQQQGLQSQYAGGQPAGLKGVSAADLVPEKQTTQTLLPRPSSLGMDTKFTGPPVPTLISSNRFAPVGGSNGFPQLPGLTGPPAHMKSGQLSQSHARRAWPSTPFATSSSPTRLGRARPGPLPMPSSETNRPASEQVHSASGTSHDQHRQRRHENAYQKYSFFQVHHNRDSARYRTPYSIWGGFTNGYQGNPQELRGNVPPRQSVTGQAGHVGETPRSVVQPWPKASIAASPVPIVSASWPSTPDSREMGQGPLPSPSAPGPAHSGAGDERAPPSSDSTGTHHTACSSTPPTPSSSTLSQGTARVGPALLHPAIRPQFNTMWQKQKAPTIWTGSRSSQGPLPVPALAKQAGLNEHDSNSYQAPLEHSDTKLSPSCSEYQHLARTAIAGGCVSKRATAPSLSSLCPNQHGQKQQQEQEQHGWQTEQHQEVNVYSDAAVSPEPDYADVPADSTALVEQVLLNLKRASAIQNSG